MDQHQTREKTDREAWLGVASKIVSGKLVARTKDSAEAMLIGLRHYLSHNQAKQAVEVIRAMKFKEQADGKDMVKRIVEEMG